MKHAILLMSGTFFFLALVPAIFFYSAFSPTSSIFGETISKINTGEKVVFLTFDDGPSTNTHKILKILNKTNTKATFFVITNNIFDNTTLKEIKNQGHDIGTHTKSHIYLYKNLKEEIGESKQIIEKQINTKVTLFRPPFGFRIPITLSTAKTLKLKTILWSSFPKDYNRTKNETIKTIITDLEPGLIIVLHDHSKQNDTATSALPEIIKQIKNKGYKFATIEDYI